KFPMPTRHKKFSDKVFNYCLKYGRKFHYFSISNHKCSDRYNPFLFGEPSQIKDKIMSVTDWSEKGDGVYYKKLSELALQVAVEELKEDITLKKIKNLIPDDEVLIGLKTDLELLDRTPFSYLMDDTENGLFEIYQQEKVFFISLDEDSYPVISESLGKIVLSDLKSLSGYINNHINENERKPISLYIDEISTFMSDFMADYFFNFLAKTRSSNISVIMASHAPKGDFEKYGSHILDRLISLTTTHIIMRNTAPDSAEYLSKMLGTKEAEKLTSQISEGVFSLKTGLGSMRPVEEFVISPNKIRKLQRAEAYIHIAEGNVLEWVYLDHYHHDKQEGISYENYFEKMNGLNENDTRGEYGPNQEKGRTGKKGEKERERTVQGKLSLRVSEQAEG
ncbi:MAG: type IV secretion system DNA-binding domain-containing protein, partial [Bacteriovoracaceae bacterium]|nr:type IV secretion system DNA-binding domain-containing protein [Bacteriovoracaceae bacterium]